MSSLSANAGESGSARRLRRSAAFGSFVWLVCAALSLTGYASFGPVELVLVLAFFVASPLLWHLASDPTRDGREAPAYLLLSYAQLPAAFATLPALLMPQGLTAALLSLPWFLVTAWSFLYGLGRFLRRSSSGRGPFRFAELAVDAGLMYVVVGGLWLVIARRGWNLGFSDAIVILTAVHFHFAGLAAPLLCGQSGRFLFAAGRGEGRSPGGPFARLYYVASLIVIFGPALTGIGIALSPFVEVVSGSILATGLALFAWTNMFLVLPRARGALNRLLMLASSLALFTAMLPALVFAFGEYLENHLVDLNFMVRTHGLLNAFVFTLLGGIVWARIRPRPVTPPPGPPFSRLRGAGPIGADFFDRTGARDERATAAAPRGLTDDFALYRRPDFDPAAQDPALARFYENTRDYELLVKPEWGPGFRAASRLYKLISNFMKQMNFPLRVDSPETLMDSRIFKLRDAMDGRDAVRAWVRVYAATGLPIYAAAYSYHTHEGRGYMNIAFPYLFGNMTSVLRLSAIDEASREIKPGEPPAGLLVTTAVDESLPGDEGIYYSTALGPVRLPFNEWIYVWKRGAEPRGMVPMDVSGAERATILARHDMTLAGLRFLTLWYYIYPSK